MNKLVLIDGQSILYTLFYGVPENGDSLHANATYAFLHSIKHMIEEEQPSHLVVFFGKETPEISENLRSQYGLIEEFMKSIGVFIVRETQNDLLNSIGTAAGLFAMEGQAVIMTADPVYLQLVSEKVEVSLWDMTNSQAHWIKMTREQIAEKYHVEPHRIPDLFALSQMQFPKRTGAQGIGLGTAGALLETYQTVEQLYENQTKIPYNWVRERLVSCQDAITKKKEQVLFLANQQETLQVEELVCKEDLSEKIDAFLSEFGIGHGATGKTAKKAPVMEQKPVFVTNKKDLETIFEACCKNHRASFRLLREQKAEDKKLGSFENGQMFLQLEEAKELFVLFLCFDDKRVFVLEQNNEISQEDLCCFLQRMVLAQDMMLSCFDEKSQYDVLFDAQATEKCLAKDLTRQLFDCDLAAYLLNPLVSDYTISAIAKEYLELEINDWSKTFGKADVKTIYQDKKQEWISYFTAETAALYLLYPVLEKQLEVTKMSQLYRELEMPLSYVLYDMEKEGILVKPDELKVYGDALMDRITELETTICEQAGETFNINSPKQLGEILFEKMMLPGGKKTKTGYSTAADVLEKLAPEYPFVKDILEYRGLTKLKSTYAEGLANYIGQDQRIHTHFNQMITATGRLSSTEPNLQNIPMRMELGRKIRKVFVPAEGCIFMDADYSQIELRVLAHMSGDESLIEAYRMEEDIHRITASKVFHTPFEEVTDLQRRNAKAVNFGIVYGISSFGLSQDLSISPKEAKVYIDEYFKTYPRIKEFLDKTVEQTRQLGYCTSMFGRRRPVPEMKSSNHMQRAFGERIAMNSPIQGTAADIIKMAMLHVYDGLKKAGLCSKLILQIHDELLIETRIEETEQVREILTREMQQVCDLAVALEIDLHTGTDWYEAK